MCDQTMPYTPGTHVWAKLIDRIWWPGRVVELSSLPEELESYKRKKKNPIATVSFSRDTSYEIVTNMDKISLYSCAKKMEFLEKGYSLYLRQMKKKGDVGVGGFDMKNFIQDVVDIEIKIGGDRNIFEEFTKKQEPPKLKVNIKDLFMPEKERQKMKRKMLAEQFKAPVRKPIIKRSPAFQSPINVGGSFPCPHCSFTTRLYDVLKIHVSTHKNANKNNISEETATNLKSVPRKSKKSVPTSRSRSSTSSTPSTPKKRNYAKTKKTDNKKVKLQDELLKDWDDEDENEALKENTVQSQDETLVEDKALDNGDTVQDNDDTNLDGNSTTQENDDTTQDKEDSAQDDMYQTKGTTEVLTTTKNVVKIISPTRIFDFDENADNELHESFQNHSNQESVSKSRTSVTKIQDHDNSSAKECSTKNKSVTFLLPEMTNSDDESSNCLFQNELTTSTVKVDEVTAEHILDTNQELTNNEDACSNNDKVPEGIKSKNESFITGEEHNQLWLKNSKFPNEFTKVKGPTMSTNETTYNEEIELQVQAANVHEVDFQKVISKPILPTPSEIMMENKDVEFGEFVYEKIPPVYTNEEIDNNEDAQAFIQMVKAGGHFDVEFVGQAYFEDK